MRQRATNQQPPAARTSVPRGCTVGTLRHWLTLLVFAWIMNATQVSAEPVQALQLGSPAHDSQLMGAALRLIYEDAFSRIGIPVEIRYCPPGRCSLGITTGELDGQIARGRCYSDWVPTLVRVEESPFPAFGVGVYERNPKVAAGGPTDQDLLVGVWRGVPELQRFVDYHYDGAARVLTRDTGQGLQMLRAGRFDVFVGVVELADPLLQAPEFQDAGIRRTGVLGTRTVHAFLDRKHAGIAVQLAATIATMRQSGDIAAHVAEASRRTGMLPVPPVTGVEQPSALEQCRRN